MKVLPSGTDSQVGGDPKVHGEVELQSGATETAERIPPAIPAEFGQSRIRADE